MAGWVRLCRSGRRGVDRGRADTEATAGRVGVLCLLYAAAAAVLLACRCHEHAARNFDDVRLRCAVAMLRIVYSVVVGAASAASAAWSASTWNAKRVRSWKTVAGRLCFRWRPGGRSADVDRGGDRVATVAGPPAGHSRAAAPHRPARQQRIVSSTVIIITTVTSIPPS